MKKMQGHLCKLVPLLFLYEKGTATLKREAYDICGG